MRRFLLLTCVLAAALPGAAGAGTVFVVEGHGWGHGIGMSQYGARGYAQAGWRHQRILAHYYPGTRLSVIPGRQVRVLLAEGRPGARIGSAKPFRVVDARGKVRRLPAGTRGARARGLRFPLRYEPGAAPLRLNGSAYRGALVVHRVGARLTIVNRLPLDRYLRGVVPWEMPDDWHPEALRAQAVVARSYALATLKPGKLFDVYPDTRSQVYGGIAAEARTTNLAVGATAGRVLTWKGRVATTFYHSTSGGRTVSIQEAWPKATPVPYLVSVADPYDRLSKHHTWGPVVFSQAELARKLGLRAVRDVLVRRGPSGRAVSVVVKGLRGPRVFDAGDFRRAIDLRSTWFSFKAMSLDPPLAAALRDRDVRLRGWVRGLAGVRLERRVGAGGWRPVAKVRPRPDGRFVAVVRAEATSQFRLAVASATGVPVRLRVR
jgi:stage II sporulation protein D